MCGIAKAMLRSLDSCPQPVRPFACGNGRPSLNSLRKCADTVGEKLFAVPGSALTPTQKTNASSQDENGSQPGMLPETPSRASEPSARPDRNGAARLANACHRRSAPETTLKFLNFVYISCLHY